MEHHKKSHYRGLSEWIGFQKLERIEKIVSVSVLAIEIYLLANEHISGNSAFYMFAAVNLAFSVFIYLTFVRADWNAIYTLDKHFTLSHNYKLSYDNKYYSGKNGLADEPLNVKSDMANKLINQFRIIRYSWLCTAILYIVLIVQKRISTDQSFDKLVEEYHIRLVCGALVLILSLLSAYYYLVAYNVMYNVTIKRSDGMKPKVIELHKKNTMWFVGVSMAILAFYLIAYVYSENRKSEYLDKIVFKSSLAFSDTLKIVGEHTSLPCDNNVVVINDDEEENVHKIEKECEEPNDTLTVILYESHRKKCIIEDHYHSYFRVAYCCDVPGHAEINANLKIVTKDTIGSNFLLLNDKISDLEVVFKSETSKQNSVDFFFQFLVGIVTALVMCFFVGRFESLTFDTPIWVLLILYFYAVIQGFLPLLEPEFFLQNEYLHSVSGVIIKSVLFIALLGKLVLYIFIQDVYETKRLFYYFVETREEKESIKEHWEMSNRNINIGPYTEDLSRKEEEKGFSEG